MGIDQETAAFAWELQWLTYETGLATTVCPLPPGTSKCNKIEHCLFAWISQNRRLKPLTSCAVILQLTAVTITVARITVQCQLDTHHHPTGGKISDEVMAMLSIQSGSFPSEWNYIVLPRAASGENSIP